MLVSSAVRTLELLLVGPASLSLSLSLYLVSPLLSPFVHLYAVLFILTPFSCGSLQRTETFVQQGAPL